MEEIENDPKSLALIPDSIKAKELILSRTQNRNLNLVWDVREH